MISVCFIFNLSAVVGFADTTLNGDGSEENPYQIGTKTEFATFAEIVTGGDNDACGILLADIELDWIGSNGAHIKTTAETPYMGTFDGNGYTVKVDMSGLGGNKGLFGYTKNATIKNLIITGSVIGTSHYMGSVCAVAEGGIFKNITSNATVKNAAVGTYSPKNLGGLIGNVTEAIVMENCAFTGNVENGEYTENNAGLFGGNANVDNEITNCYVTGTINGGNIAFGFGAYGTFTNCYFAGTLSGAYVCTTTQLGTRENVYYNSDSSVSSTKDSFLTGTPITEEQLASGELAYLLGEAFGQTIGTDLFPVFATEDNAVYTDGTIYTNTILDPAGVKIFAFMKDGKKFNDKIFPGDVLKVKVSVVDNGNNTGESVFVSYVIYDGMEMKNIGFAEIKIINSTNTEELEITVPEGENISIKAFLWNNFKDMKTVRKCMELK